MSFIRLPCRGKPGTRPLKTEFGSQLIEITSRTERETQAEVGFTTSTADFIDNGLVLKPRVNEATEAMNESLALIPKVTFGKAGAGLRRRKK